MDEVEATSTLPEVKKSSFDTVYEQVRSLTVFSKILGAFPLKNVVQKDGRKLQHLWIDTIHLWDLILCFVVEGFFVKCSTDLIFKSQTNSDEDNRKFWITITYYAAALRGTIQFLVLHYYAPLLPNLFEDLEEYHQEIGVTIIKYEKRHFFVNSLSVIRSFVLLILLEILSFLFFSVINTDGIFLNGWPIVVSFIFANLWKELPMNVFVLICKYLTSRFKEIKDEVRRVRVEKDTKDAAGRLESLRLQHAALARIVSHLERCYGMQVTFNLLFLLLDVVLQLYVYFVITRRSNEMLLVLSIYYFVMAVVVLSIVDDLQRTDKVLAEEISAFVLQTAPRDQQIQIQLFGSQLAQQSTTFSACGYFVVNNSLVASILGAAATYLVVLIQFAPYLQDLLKPNTTMTPPFAF